MLDFDNDSSTEHKTAHSESNTALLIYQSKECQQLLQESLSYGGLSAPEEHFYNESKLPDLLTANRSSLIFIEAADDLMEQAVNLSRVLSRDNYVVLIGKDDRISVIRQLEQLGFYYLFWPASRHDITTLLKTYRTDHSHGNGPQKNRSAIRVAVIAPKGGSGCTMIAAELAHNLAEETRQTGILVDHDYNASNLHIMLGKPDLPRQSLNEKILAEHAQSNSLGFIGASELLTRINPHLDFLGFESDLTDQTKNQTEAWSTEAWKYSSNAIEALSQQTSFIVEDYSASTDFRLQPKKVIAQTDCVVLVVHTSLSGLYKARQQLEQLKQEQDKAQNNSRIIIVLNHCQPSSQITGQIAKKYLKNSIDIELPWHSKSEDLLTSGKTFRDSNTRLTQPFKNLARQILGKPVTKSSLLANLLSQLPGRNSK